MMFFHLAMSCGFFLGPLIEAYITQYGGWRWNCGFIAVAAAATLVVGFFTIHETSYPEGRNDLDRPVESYAPKRSFISKLGLTHGYNKNGSFFRSVVDILSLLAYPPVTWVGMTVGSFVAWNIVVQLTSSRTFTKKPYGWELHDIGLLSISGFVGAMLAFFFGGRLIDWISNRQTRKSNQRLPEYRLLGIFIPALIGPLGILIFGLVVAHKKSWVGAAIGYAMQGFGLTAVSNVCVTYAVDAYQPVSSPTDDCWTILSSILPDFGRSLGPHLHNSADNGRHSCTVYNKLASCRGSRECKSPYQPDLIDDDTDIC
jgi:MFS family permease